MTMGGLWKMISELETLISDPADDGTLYPCVEAWEPMRSGARRRRGGKRSEMVRWAVAHAEAHIGEVHLPDTAPQAQSVSFEYPVIQEQLLPIRREPDHGRPAISAAETTNIVAQSAFLRPYSAKQVVTQCTMSSRVLPKGALMQKSDFFSASGNTANTAWPSLSPTGFSNAATGVHPGHSDFQHSAPTMLTTERLNGFGARWLQSLPVTVRPLITAKRHPHIVNKFSILWGDDDAVNAYFDELLISARPGRRGFATEVLDELVELQRAVQEQRRF
jgi:hypothetical protein